MIEEHHCPVGIHTTLKDMIRAELENHKLPFKNEEEVVDLAKQELKIMQANLDKCKKNINVLKVSNATIKRATVIYKSLHDANILLESDMEQMNVRLPEDDDNKDSQVG